MFSDTTKKTSISLKDLYRLSAEDVVFKEDLLNFIANKKNNLTIKIIGEADPSLLVALAETNPDINQFFESSQPLQDIWRKILMEHGYPDFEITSCDGKSKLTLFSQLKGVVLLNAVRVYHDTFTILNRTCEIGMLNALIQRIRLNIERVKNSGDLETHLDIILRDAEKIQKLYWSYGCVLAGLELLDLANYLNKQEGRKILNERFFKLGTNHFSWQNIENNPNVPDFITIVKLAVEYLYLALALSKTTLSQKIEAAYTAVDDDVPALGNYRDAREFEKAVFVKLDDLHIPLRESFCRKAQEKAEELAEKSKSILNS